MDAAQLTQEQRVKIRALVEDFPRVWQDPKSSDRDRKRMARLLLEDVTLRRGEDLTVQVRFKGGATHELHLPLPQSVTVTRKTKPEIIAEIDRLLDAHSEAEIVQILSERGCRSSCGHPFTLTLIQGLRRAYHLKSRFERFRAQGFLTADQVEQMLGPGTNRANYWERMGVLKVVKLGQHYGHLYYRPTQADLERMCKRHRKPRTDSKSLAHAYEAQ